MRDLTLFLLMTRLVLAQLTFQGRDGSTGFSYQTQDNQRREEMRYSDGTVAGNYSHSYPTGEQVRVTYRAGTDGYAESRQYGYGASADRTPYRQQSRPASQMRTPAPSGYDTHLQELTDDWNLARQPTTPFPYPRRPVMTYNAEEEEDRYTIPTRAQQQESTTTPMPYTTTPYSYPTPSYRATTAPSNEIYGRRLMPTTQPPSNPESSYNPSSRNQSPYTAQAEQELERFSLFPENLSGQQMMILAAILAAAEGGYNLGPNPLENVVQFRNGEAINSENQMERQETDVGNSVYGRKPQQPPQNPQPPQATRSFPQPIVIPIILSGMQLQNTPNSVVGSRLTAQTQSTYNDMERLTENLTTTSSSRPTTERYREPVQEILSYSTVAPNTGYYFIPAPRQTTPQPEIERLNDLSPQDYDVDTYRPRPRVTSAATTTTTTTMRTTPQTSPPETTTSPSSDSETSTASFASEPPSPVRAANLVGHPRLPAFTNVLRVPLAYFFPGTKIPYPVVPQASKRVGQ